MTKPFPLLQAAGLLLEDATNAVATKDVAEFIQPTVDVLRLADEPRELAAGFLMTGALTYRFRHGPVRQGEVWEYLEMTLLCAVKPAASNFTCRVIMANNLGNYPVGTAQLVGVGAFVNFLRAKNTLPGAAVDQRGVESSRPLKLYPGEILEIESDAALAAADTVFIAGVYVRQSSPTPAIKVNDNADNVVTEEF